MFVTGDGNNRTGWSSVEYDRLIALAAGAAETERRFSYFRDAENLLVNLEAPICPLYYYVGIQFYDSRKLGGMKENLLDEHPLRYLHWRSH